jgi:hypothetical protein
MRSPASSHVVPAKAGTHLSEKQRGARLRGGDGVPLLRAA